MVEEEETPETQSTQKKGDPLTEEKSEFIEKSKQKLVNMNREELNEQLKAIKSPQSVYFDGKDTMKCTVTRYFILLSIGNLL